MDSFFSHGCEWVRADFHLHTIKDKEFKYESNENEFFKKYIDGLKSQNIKLGVITNHNKFDYEEYKNLKKVAQKEGIYLMPGVELSVKDGANGIHFLVVFDKEAWLINGENFIEQFLVSAFEGISNRENENTSCKYNIEKLFEVLNEHRKDGRDTFLIAAHVNQKKGFFEELDGGRIKNLVENPFFKDFVLGFQKVQKEDLQAYKDWFKNGLPACVQGSDCKKIDDIGKGDHCYIKIGDFNFDSVKYALSNKDYRISKILPEFSNGHLKSIEIIGGKFDGEKISFSPELNTFIGIRGSGKSGLVELVRYVLGINLQTSAADKEYKNELISYILGSGGKLVARVIGSDKKEYRIEKIYGQKETVLDSKGTVLDCTIDAIFKRPIYFGQKDLSNKDNDFENDLLQRLVGNKLANIENEISEKRQEIIAILLEMQKNKNLDEQISEIDRIIKDANQQLTIYKEKGIEEKLKTQTEFNYDKGLVERTEKNLEEFSAGLTNLLNNYDIFFKSELKGSDLNKEEFSKLNNIFGSIVSEFSKLKESNENIKQFITQYKGIRTTIDEKFESMQDEFAEIKRELNSDIINPDTFLHLTKTVETSQIKLQTLRKGLKIQTESKQKLLTKLYELDELWLREFNSLKEEAEKINKENENISIELIFKGQKSVFLEKLKSTLRGGGIRETTFTDIADKYKDFVDIYKDNFNGLQGLLNDNLFSFFKNKFNENLQDLLTFRVDDEVIISYKGKKLRNLSLGQRASALILFLLAQKDNDVLIIDQPEDDLDNQTIYDEVIKELLKLKGNMQFIFATHNANIPVLGDSEKVLTFSFGEEKIDIVQGSIDTPEIQKTIINIMEGGKEAFNKRNYIYNIWQD